jgi:hypothetical protein
LVGNGRQLAPLNGVWGTHLPPLLWCYFCKPLQLPITDKDTVDISIHILNRTGLFHKEYKTWILHGNNTSKTNDFVSFRTLWENTAQIAAFTTVPASQHGYGMAPTNNNALAHSLTDALSTFGTAYAATQESLRLNAVNIGASQGQFQMLFQAVGIGQPPQQQPGRTPNERGCGQQCAGNSSGSKGGSNSSGGGYNNSGSSSSGYSNGSGGYNGSGGGGNAYSSGGGNGSNYGGGNGGGNRQNQIPSSLPPLPVKGYEN